MKTIQEERAEVTVGIILNWFHDWDPHYPTVIEFDRSQTSVVADVVPELKNRYPYAIFTLQQEPVTGAPLLQIESMRDPAGGKNKLPVFRSEEGVFLFLRT